MEKIGASVPRLLDLPRADSSSAPDREAYLSKRVGILCACYRKDEAADPEIYAAAAIAVLSEYPLDIVDWVTDPRTGLPSKVQWLPTIKEIHDACDAKVDDERRARQRDADLRQQFADRDEYERWEAERGQRSNYNELRAKHDGPNGEKWGIGEPPKREWVKQTADEISQADMKLIEEWQAHGLEPRFSSGRPLSFSLAKLLDPALGQRDGQ